MLRVAEEAGVKARHSLIIGVPDQSILEAAQESRADILAMGTHGRTGWDRLQFGSTAESVVRQATCPVLTVHAAVVGDPPMTPRRLKLTRILVATDFSADAQAALRYAAILATYLRAYMLLVHAEGEAWVSSCERGAVLHAPSQPHSNELQDAISFVKNLGIAAEGVCTPGPAVDAILKKAQTFMADLIVMGTRRTTPLRRLMLGSVANTVIRRAGCPVLVAKDHGD